MATEKPPYKLTVKLEGAKAERVAEALTELREQAAAYDQTPEVSATMIIEAWRERDLTEVMAAFEAWLYEHAIGLDCEMKLVRPGIRPETIAMRQREQQQTPMDKIQGFAEKYGATIEFVSSDREPR